MQDNRRPRHLTLPPLPYITHQILLATLDPTVNADTIAGLIGREPGLAARIAAAANAAFFSGRGAITGLREAIVRLGVERVRTLTATLLIAPAFDASHCPAFDASEYWCRAAGTAFAAGLLAKSADVGTEPGTAHLCGLLHNIGLLLLAHALPQETSAALAQHRLDTEQDLAALLRMRTGTDANEAGALLLREWTLPEPLVTVAANVGVAHYHGEHDRLVRLVEGAAEWVKAHFENPPVTLRDLAPEESIERTARECHREWERIESLGKLLG